MKTPSENPLAIARDSLLTPSGLDEGRLTRVLGSLMGHAIDNADLYFQLSREESWALEDSIVKDGSHSLEQGVGVRAMSGEKTGFAYSDEIILPALEEASRAARAIARQGDPRAVQAWTPRTGHRLYVPMDPLVTMNDADKVSLLERIDAETRRMDPRIVQVMASLNGLHEVVLVITSDGVMAADVRPLVRINVSVIAEQSGRREQGFSGGGGRFGLNEITLERCLGHAREAVRQALVNDGIVATRIIVDGEGAESPVADNKTPKGRLANRRVAIKLYVVQH
jgi:TldD protein